MFKIKKNNIMIVVTLLAFLLYMFYKRSERTESFLNSRPLNIPQTKPKQFSVSKCVSDCEQSHQSFPNHQPACKIICPAKVARHYNENLMQYN